MTSVKVEAKLKALPQKPGVYFHKDKTGEIIYVGKAANLRNRVRQYFQKSRYHDPKTDVLVGGIADIEWAEVETEADALFLEAELIRRYQPRFNILLRDDKSSTFIRVDYKSSYPTVVLVRRPLDDGAEYFGPYINSNSIRKALRYLRRAFPYASSRPASKKRVSLHYHLGLDPGLEEGKTSLEDYRKNLKKLMQYFKGQRVAIVKELERDMKRAAAKKDYEQAAVYRNQLFAIKELNRQILFSDHELLDANRDQALAEIAKLFALENAPRRIEGFDISHMQGSDNVASMVVFINGLPDKASYRKFKMVAPGNDDFAHMGEVIKRRFRPENIKKWGLPDFVLIDGGKGQLSAAINAREQAGMVKIPMVGLAKRHEELVIDKQHSLVGKPAGIFAASATSAGGFVRETGGYYVLAMPNNSNLVKLLQRVRDESHRFAVSYHTSLKRARQTRSLLEDIPGVGPATRKKLIKAFGSSRGVAKASEQQLAAVVGKTTAHKLTSYLLTRG